MSATLEDLPSSMPVDEEEIAAVVRAMRGSPLTTLWGGHEIDAFEREFAELFGSRFAVAVTSGTTALSAALLAANVGPGDEVIVTPFSFVASVSVVVQAGATPVFADVDPQTFVMDPESVATRIGPATKAILAVHQCGYPVAMTRLMELARAHELTVIEDCAAAHGARVDGRAVGTIGDYGCFSFNIGKIMRTGEGGMVLTQDEDTARRLRAIRVNGLELIPDVGVRVTGLGNNYTMMHVAAAIGRVQVTRYHALAARRREIIQRMLAGLDGLPLTIPPARAGLEPAYYSVVFTVPEALAPELPAAVARMQAAGVSIGLGNAQLLHQIDYIRAVARGLDCPVIDRVRPRMMFFDPIPAYTDEQVERMIDVIRREFETQGWS